MTHDVASSVYFNAIHWWDRHSCLPKAGRNACPVCQLALAITALLVAGCVGKSLPTGEVEFRTIDAPGLAYALQKHRGEVVLVEFWATWCAPCLELFPHTVELHRCFADQGLAVITVSLDDLDNSSPVRKFLTDHGATTENFFSSYGVGADAFDAFKIDDGALPHVQLYDRQGRLHKTFGSGGKSIDPAEVARAVEKMLK
jgi:thiol-disulfide isomerase/thioredoxin